MKLSESLNDKNLLKAVFLAGGPGSGKSFIASGMFDIAKDNISFLGVKVINSDILFEAGLSKANLPQIIDVSKEETYKAQTVVRDWAKKASKTQQGFYINSLLPLVVDGTGKNYKKIVDQAEALRALGYDVSMVFVNTTLEVAQYRNTQRARQVDPDLVEKMWVAVQSNLGKFQRFFGNDNFVVIDNSKAFDADSTSAIKFAKELSSTGRRLLSRPLRNPIGRRYLEQLSSIGGKYLSDLPDKDLS